MFFCCCVFWSKVRPQCTNKQANAREEHVKLFPSCAHLPPEIWQDSSRALSIYSQQGQVHSNFSDYFRTATLRSLCFCVAREASFFCGKTLKSMAHPLLIQHSQGSKIIGAEYRIKLNFFLRFYQGKGGIHKLRWQDFEEFLPPLPSLTSLLHKLM